MIRTGPRVRTPPRLHHSARSPDGGLALGRPYGPAEPAKPDRSAKPDPLGCGGRHGGARRRPAAAHRRFQSARPLHGVRGEIVDSSANDPDEAAGSRAAALAPIPPAAPMAGVHSAGHTNRRSQPSRTDLLAHARLDTENRRLGWKERAQAKRPNATAPTPEPGAEAGHPAVAGPAPAVVGGHIACTSPPRPSSCAAERRCLAGPQVRAPTRSHPYRPRQAMLTGGAS